MWPNGSSHSSPSKFSYTVDNEVVGGHCFSSTGVGDVVYSGNMYVSWLQQLSHYCQLIVFMKNSLIKYKVFMKNSQGR